jgi:NhaP-type Na+/H+ or K+/H+ antiporter
MDKKLSLIIEGESLLNDGTAAALFQIVLAGIISGHLSVYICRKLMSLAALGGFGNLPHTLAGAKPCSSGLTTLLEP